MKNLKNWLNKNNFSFEVQKNMLGEEIIFIKVQGVGSENAKKIKTYLKRYKFNFEYRSNYTYILAKKEETKIYKTIDNSIVQAATKENKINDLLVEKANKLIESIEIEHNRSAAKYLDYAKENGIKTSDKNSLGRKVLQCHLMKYGISNMWYKAAEKHGVNTKEELYNVYFNQLIDMLRAEEEAKEEIKTPFKMDLQALASNKKELKPIFNSNIEGHEEYQKEQLKIYNSNTLKFTHKRINNKMIEEYTKYFVYKDNKFMSVKPGKNYPSSYYDHVRKYNYKVDHVNKVILFTDKEIEEVEPIKEEFYNNEVEPAAEETEQEQQDRENKEYIYNFIEEHRHIEKIDPFIENNKIEYFVSIQNYIQVFYIDKDNYNFNAVIEDYQFIKRNVNSLEVEGLIQSVFSIMKNYKKYKVIDHNFIKYEIDVFQCIDLSISDIKDIIRIDNIKDITIESDLITMYKDNEVIAYIDIKKDIPGFTKYTDTEQRILLKYYYDKLTESNISYYLIDNKVINQ